MTRLVDSVAARGTASVVLTGGGIGTGVLAELAAAPARDAIDWRRLDIWWGDERFVPAGDPDRNETGARAALLDHVDVDPARVHPMPGPDGPDGDDPEAAAARYACWLAAATKPEDHGQVPEFDILMLGIGPEAHVASLFPGMPALYDERPVVAVRGSPKPPPTRLSLTLAVDPGGAGGLDPGLGPGESRRGRDGAVRRWAGAGSRRGRARQAADAIPDRQCRRGQGSAADRPPGRALSEWVCQGGCRAAGRTPGRRPGKPPAPRRARTGS